MVSLPRNPMDARVASQRCPILPWGKTPLYYQLQGVMSRVRVALVFSSTWLKYSLSLLYQVAQVFISISGSNTGQHVAQIFVDIHSQLGDSAIQQILPQVVEENEGEAAEARRHPCG